LVLFAGSLSKILNSFKQSYARNACEREEEKISKRRSVYEVKVWSKLLTEGEKDKDYFLC